MAGKHLVWFDTLDENVDKAQWRDLSSFEEYLPERYRKASEAQKNAGHGGGDFFLVEDFVNAVRMGTRRISISTRPASGRLWVLLSELSVMNGGRTIDMPDFRKGGIENQVIRL